MEDRHGIHHFWYVDNSPIPEGKEFTTLSHTMKSKLDLRLIRSNDAANEVILKINDRKQGKDLGTV